MKHTNSLDDIGTASLARRKALKDFSLQYAIYLVFLALIIGISIKAPAFLSLQNFRNILSTCFSSCPIHGACTRIFPNFRFGFPYSSQS
ncbi:MAG: methyl-galactoside transport system permease protein [Spirochaetes bacterium]|nr:MAG: methyl-galactoside transport system permease protein [Spirochaetota bacterium]